MAEKVAEFCGSAPNARKVLDAYNTVDPFQCYFGEDCNPDEYLGYAKRYLDSDTTATPFERVKSTFYDSQTEEGWVTDDQIAQIAKLVV